MAIFEDCISVGLLAQGLFLIAPANPTSNDSSGVPSVQSGGSLPPFRLQVLYVQARCQPGPGKCLVNSFLEGRELCFDGEFSACYTAGSLSTSCSELKQP